MKDTKYPSILYHYASMEKAISILKYKNFRLSDITKSNDVNEMSICFPRLFDEMINSYDVHNGFSYEFTYKEFESRFGKGSFVFVETNGGFHILLDKSKLKQNPNNIINTVLKHSFSLSGEIGKKLNANYSFGNQLIDEFKYNNNKDKENREARNCMLPTPGTYQYGNIVRVRNKEDFE